MNKLTNFRQLLDEVFAISGNNQGRGNCYPAEADNTYRDLIIPDIAKTESNNCFIIHCFTGKQNNGKQFQHLCPSRLPASERFFP